MNAYQPSYWSHLGMLMIKEVQNGSKHTEVELEADLFRLDLRIRMQVRTGDFGKLSNTRISLHLVVFVLGRAMIDNPAGMEVHGGDRYSVADDDSCHAICLCLENKKETPLKAGQLKAGTWQQASGI
nr:hypothetical protein Iba_scaffold259CG0180 [Ipomoea batatas]